MRIWSWQHVSVIISSYDDHHIIIWWSSYHHKAEKTLHMLYFRIGGDFRLSNMILWSVILVIWWIIMIIILSFDDHHLIIWWSSYHPTSNMKQKRPITCYIFENEGTQGYQIWYSGVSFLSYDDYHIIIWCLSYHHMMIIMLSYKDHQQTENMLYFHQRLY